MASGAAPQDGEMGIEEEGFICRHEMFACSLCGLPVKRGERIYPVRPEGEDREVFARDWVHFSCAQSHDVITSLERRPVCKHWAKKGFCFFKDKCFFAHPAEACGQCQNLKPRTWGGRRVRVLNDGRANSFRRFIIEKFGYEVLRSGSGVMDVAGGKGELTFLFENLNGIRSTCVEPRPLQLRSFVRRFTFGMYHRSTLGRRHVTRGYEEGMREIHHVRMCLSEAMVEALLKSDSSLQGIIQGSLEEAQRKVWTSSGLHEHETDETDDTGEEEECETRTTHEEGENETAGNPGARTAEKYTVPDTADIIGIESVEEIIRIIRGVSFIAGMHPDQATGPLVDLALGLRIPFAVVPCCVYSKEFPRRTLCDGTRVRSYDSFLQYLSEKDPGIKQETLEFEGKNKVLYWLPQTE